MIPHRTPGPEIFGNGLRNRVTACRKRLRVKRAVHNAHVRDQSDAEFQKPANQPEFPAGTSEVRQLADLELLSVFSGVAESEDSRVLEGQEAGVT